MAYSIICRNKDGQPLVPQILFLSFLKMSVTFAFFWPKRFL